MILVIYIHFMAFKSPPRDDALLKSPCWMSPSSSCVSPLSNLSSALCRLALPEMIMSFRIPFWVLSIQPCSSKSDAVL